jgi:hypothetical protein
VEGMCKVTQIAGIYFLLYVMLYLITQVKKMTWHLICWHRPNIKRPFNALYALLARDLLPIPSLQNPNPALSGQLR